MEIKTTEDIADSCCHFNEDEGYLEYKEQFDKTTKWVSVDNILQDLEDTIEKGNMIQKGFSPALWISDLKKKLKGD